jgi:hypothetical protein
VSQDDQSELTDELLASMGDKQRKNPDVVRLFQTYPYMEAYAKHTDMRVRTLGLPGAVGADADWERHGDLQSKFLIAQGLRPHHVLLDYG